MPAIIHWTLIIGLALSCQPSEKKNSGATATAAPSLAVPYRPIPNYQGDFKCYEDLDCELEAGSDYFSGQNLAGMSFSISGEPSWMNINPATGDVSGIPDASGVFSSIVITATNGAQTLTTPAFSVAVDGDPLRIYQWHLENSGQNNFAINSGTAGEDMSVKPVWQRDVKGLGVKIAVSDAGVEINHPDLYENMLSGSHRNYHLENPWIGNPEPSSGHGTSVSGIIAAMGWNNLGVTGVAPKAKIGGFQFLDSDQTIEILLDQANGDFDIFNYSYGDTTYEDQVSDQDYISQLRLMTENGRSGKGVVFVKAAGNEYRTCLSAYQGIASFCTPHNANMPLENEVPFLMVVGAVNAEGKKSTYSNAGSNLWVTAPGGEFGSSRPAIMTTDWTECSKGLSTASSLINSFEYGHSENTFCDYTSSMNGSSSATPMTVGAVALLLSAKPSLSWRDVKHILALTADKVDGTQGVTAHPTAALALAGHVYEQGWVQNAAGFWFNNWYGFGRVNAEAAVQYALSGAFSPLPPLVELNPEFNLASYEQTGLGLSIPDADPAGRVRQMNVTANLTVETIQIQLNVTHPESGQLGVELTSPSGTKSILLNINNSLLRPGSSGADANFIDLVLSSHAFYGENSQGNWQLKLIDGRVGHTGTLQSWAINMLAH
jgi:subtilisin-like proprotein convertase family protein